MNSHAAAVRRAQISADVAAEVRRRFGTPCYVYDRAALEAAARAALAFPAPFGLTLSYAMKANPSRGILTFFRDLGLHVDASSDHEVERAGRRGVGADESRARYRLHQAHQHRRARLELRDLARGDGRGGRDRQAPR